MVSCIILAYNINNVGRLITNLKDHTMEKVNSMKTFQEMAKENKIEVEFENKINNHIEENYEVNSKLNFKGQDTLLNSLPTSLRKQYMKRVCRNLFGHLHFIKDLTKKAQHSLAENFTRQMLHPD